MSMEDDDEAMDVEGDVPHDFDMEGVEGEDPDGDEGLIYSVKRCRKSVLCSA